MPKIVPDTTGQKGKEVEEINEPTTSNTQLLERQKSIEVSSFVRLADKEGIKDRYKEIKLRNEKLKAATYPQYFKHSAPNQRILMSTFDIKGGNIQMSYMHPTVPQPKSSVDYKKATFELLAKDIHPLD